MSEVYAVLVVDSWDASDVTGLAAIFSTLDIAKNYCEQHVGQSMKWKELYMGEVFVSWAATVEGEDLPVYYVEPHRVLQSVEDVE